MKRELERLKNEVFDLLVVGGGITGACLARDASLRGLRVALIEKRDFAHATSAHNSKLVHGGLRYLRNFELRLVRESLQERRIWQRIAPHLVAPLPFLLPLYSAGLAGRATVAAGLTLYDLLSFDRAWLDDPDQRLPRHSWVDRKRALALEPILERDGLEGAFLYFDAQMYSPERLALECLLDAAEQGAAIANYVEASTILVRQGRAEGVSAVDDISGEHFDIRAGMTIVATGPWTDIFLASALARPPAHRILRSKGIHILVEQLTRRHALTMASGGGHFFVLPWRGYSLLGTTDNAFSGDPDEVSVSDADISAFLDEVNLSLPQAGLTPGRICHSYAGLRPLVDDGEGDTYSASRRAELIDHARTDGIEGLLSVIGGKWTTSRALAETVIDKTAERFGRRILPCTTATRRLPGAPFGHMRDFEAQQSARFGEIARSNLIQMYGSRVDKLLAGAEGSEDLLRPLGSNGDIAAQVPFAVREEMAITLRDVVTRRTGIGQFGPPATATLEAAANLMGAELKWSELRKTDELASFGAGDRTRESA
ncbi:MAG: glycerol-3-phosphate dehydrogenase/oxidase [Alphaproteobacteria bacterium]|nr:glycerol-3-phosphate dehydrogenase/oxidase [Alphaproteobacteria bacterium]